MVTKLETQGKQIFQWGEKFVDIATLEKAVYEAVLSLGRNIMRQCIEEADRTLARQRDRGMYRDKGYRPTTLKTVMGEVGYQRHVYLLSGAAEQPRATVYLLDRSMGLDTVGLFSDTVCMMAVEAACAVSHRTAAATLNDLTGLSLSHESVWRIVQNAGSWEQARVDSLAAAAKAECGSGTYETPVLYEEMDGVYLALQGKDRLEHGPSKEMKVSIAYSGIYEDASGRRGLANKVSYASMEQAEHFRRHAEGVVADFYAVDCVKRRVFNSDGGTWLQLWWRHLLRAHWIPTNKRSGGSCLPTSTTTGNPLFHTTNGVEENPRCPTRASSPPGVGAWRATSLPLLGTG